MLFDDVSQFNSLLKHFSSVLSKGWFPLLRKFYVRTGVNLIRDDVWRAYVNVKSWKFSTFYIYGSRSYIVSNFIYARKAS